MKLYAIKIISIFCFCSTLLVGQNDTSITQAKSDRYFRYNYDNDFFTALDRYYTQGVYIELIMPIIRKSPFSKTLIPLKKNALNYYGLNIEQDGFTPRSIRHEGIWVGERPFASVFFVSHFLHSIDTEKKRKLTTRLDLGIIGPDAGNENVQKGIHYALDNIQPLGWENQIALDYVVNYNAQIEQEIYSRNKIELIAFANARVGTLYDDIAGGAILRLGWMQPYFKNLGMTKQRAGEGIRRYQFYIYSKAQMKVVGYNATLQGGMFNKNSVYTIPSDDIQRAVALGQFGLVFAFRRVSFEYSRVYIGSEFTNKLVGEFDNGKSHGWGHIAITTCF